MKSLKLAAVVALLFGSTALGDSKIKYILELGGDNHFAEWEAGGNPPFTSGIEDDGQVYDENAILTWDAVVQVTGAHSGGDGDGEDTNGAANLCFSLELRDNLGELVGVQVGWESAMNDGDPGGFPPGAQNDPLEEAAFCHIFDVDANGTTYPDGAGPPDGFEPGRAWDPPVSGGPNMDRAQYPTSILHGGGRNTQGSYKAATGIVDPLLDPAKLVGMGCGYSQFNASASPSTYVAGVGIDPFASLQLPLYRCYRGTGHLPIFEGQINTANLDPGVYTLHLVAPEDSNNVLRGDFDCDSTAQGHFSVKANQTEGDMITFEIKEGILPPNWSSMRTHTGLGLLAIALDPNAAADKAASEPRKDVHDPPVYSNGLQEVWVQFNTDVSAYYTAGQVAVSGGVLAVTGEALTTGGTRLEIYLSGSVNLMCYQIDVSNSFNYAAMGLAVGDFTCPVRTLLGDTSGGPGPLVYGDGQTNNIDYGAVKGRSGQSVLPDNIRFDVNTDGQINNIDFGAVKGWSGMSVVCP